MLDSITLFVDQPDQKYGFPFEKLSNGYPRVNPNTGEILENGYINNIYVKQSPCGILITGSITKYILGHNLENLPFDQIVSGFTSLLSELNLNPSLTKVFRFDMGYNFIMDKTVTDYLSTLGDISRYVKSVYGNYESVLYKNTLRSIIFYDKVKEYLAKNSSSDLIDKYPKNILRYEVQFKRDLKGQFGLTDSLTVEQLINLNFLSKVLDQYKSIYNSINKSNEQDYYFDFSKGTKVLTDYLAMIGIKYLGIEKLLARLNSQSSNLNKSQLSRQRKTLRKLWSGNSCNSNLIRELDNKVMSLKIE